MWFVSEVLRSGVNTYTAICVGSHEFLEDLRRRPSSDLVSDLLLAARKPIRGLQADVPHESAQSATRALEWRDDWIEKYLSAASQNGLADPPAQRRSRGRERGDWLEKYLQRCRNAQQEQDGTTSIRQRARRRLLRIETPGHGRVAG